MNILVEIAPGELIDKITILEIKIENIRDQRRLENVKHEYRILRDIYKSSVPESEALSVLAAKLKTINQKIWQLEDDIRDCERVQDFGPKFIGIARSVYRTNDERASVKRQINELLGSKIIEEKSYSSY